MVESGEFDWSNGRFPIIEAPSPAYHGLKFHETFGTFGFLMKLRCETLRDLGACMSPFNAFLLAQGIETLPLRMRAHVSNALAVAEFLQTHTQVSGVHYAGLSASPYQTLVQKYLPKGAGAVFCFDLVGGREAGIQLIEQLSLFSHLANVGDAKSLVIHPRHHHPSAAKRHRTERRRHLRWHHTGVHRHRGCARPHRRLSVWFGRYHLR